MPMIEPDPAEVEAALARYRAAQAGIEDARRIMASRAADSRAALTDLVVLLGSKAGVARLLGVSRAAVGAALGGKGGAGE
jgi:hypothetical protein